MESINTRDGGRYVGQLKNGIRSGHGAFYLPSGDSYFGEWENDVFHGKGVYVYAKGDRYQG